MSFGTKTITLFKALCLALITVCLFTLLMPWLSATISTLHVGINVFATSVKGEYTSFWSVMLIINAILFILLAALGIFGLLKDKNTLVLPLGIVAFLMFLLAVFQRFFIDEKELHVGLGAWLILFLGLLACGLAILDNLAAGKKPVDFKDFGVFGVSLPKLSRPGAGSWTCPTCGAVQGASILFCDRCGTRKPEPPRCPGCGKVCQPGEAFCANCGTRL